MQPAITFPLQFSLKLSSRLFPIPKNMQRGIINESISQILEFDKFVDLMINYFPLTHDTAHKTCFTVLDCRFPWRSVE
jgi:hypothetical protein